METRRSEPVDARRRFLVSAGLALLVEVTRTARAALAPAPPERGASPEVPRAVLDLDAAALSLFDAAEAGRWDDARKAIASARTAAHAMSDLESSFTEAGGELNRFFAATNQLSADLIDASAAESVRDRPWLVSSADNLLARAGELTEPFASRIQAAAPRLEVLLVLARRMRQAPTWEDDAAFAAARRDFDRLWSPLRNELGTRRPQLVVRVDAARAGLVVAPSSDNARTLYVAVRGLLGALAAG